MPRIERCVGLIMLIVTISATGWPSSAAAVDFETTKLVIEAAGGARYPFTVELARSPEQHHQGLMFREHIAEDGGMLFIMPSEQQATFWMRNTFVSLDMLFIGRGGRIVNIHPRAVPGSNALIDSDGPVIAVLEITGGLSARLGLHPGDRVVHPALN
ncbi:MAG: DUF192 domain-containing protein [Azospirillum sp.]|nr:DUF192 domain-containing protein [Azospirillum sp.]